jgi:GGDEF domain-containing protein
MSQLVSLGEEIRRSELRDVVLKASLECYAHTVGLLESELLHQIALKTGKSPVQLQRERSVLSQTPPPHEIRQIGARLAEILVAAGSDLRLRLAGSVELSEVLNLVTQAAEKVGARSAAQESAVSQVSSRFRKALDVGTVVEFREKIAAEVSALEHLVSRMSEENRDLLEGLEVEMANYRRKLDEAKSYTLVDPLTNLPNREALQEAIREAQLSDVRLSLVVIEIGSLLHLQEQRGREVTDELVRQVAQRLRAASRPGEFVARLHAAAFAVFFPLPKRDAMLRGRLIEQSLRCEFRLRPDLRLAVPFFLAVTEPLPDENAEDLIARTTALIRPA